MLECAWDATGPTATVVAEHGGFSEPRGLADLGGAVYVADRAGHSIWRLETAGAVRVAGTGRMGTRAVSEGRAVSAELRSPWGLARSGGTLVVAMAGTHQLWALDPLAETLSLLAGTGAEAIADGPASRAALAQPTGLALLGESGVAFVDCETQAVRILRGASVETLVGTGLFDFGDLSGVGEAARLQHCEDVTVHRDVLVVADTYNDRLKRVDPLTRTCLPWAGQAGESGQLREPGGVWSDGSTLLVADTGNHRIVVVDDTGSLTEVRFDFD